MKLKFKKINPVAILPKYQTPGASGFDLHSVDNLEVPIGRTVVVGTGLSVQVPYGYELQIRPRSGLSRDTGLMIKNSPGTIDSDYRGEIKIIIYNTGERWGHYINYGDRIAQGVLVPVVQAEIEEVEGLDETSRGSGGFGSTG
jgi:dUTP pyrophosphatase